jgi:hypothetical protein
MLRDFDELTIHFYQKHKNESPLHVTHPTIFKVDPMMPQRIQNKLPVQGNSVQV